MVQSDKIFTKMENIQLLVKTVQELSLVRDIESVMQIVRTVARKLTGADGATFVLRDNDLCYYADEDAISPLWKGSRFPIQTCISGWAMLNKKPAVIPDIYVDERIPIDAYRPTFVKSLVMVPIRTINPIGAIGNYWANNRMPAEEEIASLQALADITAVSIENIEVHGKLEEKLNERSQMVIQLEKQKKQLEEFTHIIAHNMRAPLSNLLLLNDLISQSSSLDEKLLYLEKQKPVVTSLQGTFEELVSALQVQMDFNIQRDHVLLEDCVGKAEELLQGDILSAQADIAYDFSRAKEAYFPQKYLNSIMLNLLSNAIKYREPKRRPEIRIHSYKKNGWTYLEVRDNGLGIDLEKHGDKLFMLHKTFHQHPNAKGFGLFITKTQLEAMGGSIEAESSPGHGTKFILKLFKNK